MRRAAHAPFGLSAIDRRAFFGVSAHPRDGVEPSAIEAALVDLERALCLDRCHAVVAAPVGPGRGLLFRILAELLARTLRVVQVSASGAEPDELCARIVRGLGDEPGPDAELRLASIVHELSRRGSALAVLVEDAAALPEAALRRLGRLAALSRPDLRLALGVPADSRCDGAAVARVVASLGVSAEKIVLESRLDRSGPAAPRAPRALEPPREPGGGPRPAAARWEAIRVETRPRTPRSGPGWRHAAAALAAALSLIGIQRLAVLPGDGAEPAVPRAAPAEATLPSVAAQPVAPPEQPAPAAPAPLEIAPEPEAAAPARAPDPVAVSLNARPWARIEVDGKEVGVTPLADVPLAPGVHRFRARLADGRVIERTTRVDAFRNHLVFP